MNTKYSLKLRSWQLSDAAFIVKLRNSQELRRWFRQNHNLTIAEQKRFMKVQGWDYRGKIILLNGKRIGVGAIKSIGELSLVLPNKYKLLRREIIKLLIGNETRVWGEVFSGNPISWDLEMLGFKPVHTLYEYKKD